jgi:hypothetical protein
MSRDSTSRLAALHGVPVSFGVNHRGSLWTVEEAAPVYRRIVAGRRTCSAARRNSSCSSALT